MTKAPIDAAGELQRAFELLTRNWQLALPTAVASVIIVVVGFFTLASLFATVLLGGGLGGTVGGGLAALGSGLLLGCAFLAVAAMLTALAQAIVIRAAEDAWEGRRVDLGASLSAVLPRMGPLIVVWVLALLLLVIPAALIAVVIGVPLVLLVAFFLIYALPAVVLGGEDGPGAIAASYRLARANVGPSAVAFVGILVAGIAGGLINGIFHAWPVVNAIVAFAVGGLTSAYAALVAARFYTLLQAAPNQKDVTVIPQR